jgi:transposase
MAMGRQGDRQGDLMVTWSEMPRSPGHVFYDRLQEVLLGAGFDGFVEDACQAYYARTMGAPSVPPGHQFSFWVFGMRRCGLARVGEIEALLSRAGAVEA